MLTNPIITLTTDFGHDDAFVGVMKGAILSVNPRVNIIDLNHGIPSHDIRGAALSIGMNYKFFPDRTVHIVVVDPGVGSVRRPLIVITDRHYFIGPDNGVFSYIYKMEKESLQVIHVTADHYFLKLSSSTFHGRDVFAPVSAWLTSGTHLQHFGEPISDYVSLDLPVAVVGSDSVKGEVIHVDKFGNAITNLSRADVNELAARNPGSRMKVMIGNRSVPMKSYYGEALNKDLCAIINSSDYIEFFVNRGSASSLFSISSGDQVEIQIAR